MKVHEYDSYEEYKAIQIKGNVKKIKKVFVGAVELDGIIKYIADNNLTVKSGVCHGVRRGWEVEYLRDKLESDIFGTEISHTAKKFKNVIEWDFHETKEEWKNKFDLIYSNSFDHSYKPEECLKIWMSTLSKNGKLYLHWTRYSQAKHTSRLDPFGATREEYKEMIEKNYILEDTIRIPSKRKTTIFVVKNK